MEESRYSKGLAGVIADESRICLVDGERGKLYYYGYAIEDIVERKSYDETVYLLIHGKFPTPEELADHRRKTAAASALPGWLIDTIRAIPPERHPMEVLQAVLPLMGGVRPTELRVERRSEPDGTKRSEVAGFDAQRDELVRLLARIPTVVACYHRLRHGEEPVAPDRDLTILANFLYMFHGARAPERDVEIFEICEILQMEHGFNASTFTARVVASTLSPLATSLSAATGALYGKLHGGADEAAFRMARDDIGGPGEAEAWVRDTLARGGKIMGMGHRVYRTLDPRARILKTLALELVGGKGGEKESILKTLVRVEEVMAAILREKGKDIHPNVEFYKGPVFHALDIPTEYFTALFVIARAAGWGAHVLELWGDHRIYRPRAQFIGDVDKEI